MTEIDKTQAKVPKATKLDRKEPLRGERDMGRSRGFWSRLGIRTPAADESAATRVINSIQDTLPDTDPLRRARLQTHLFMGQLPEFPLTKDVETTTEDRPNRQKSVRTKATPEPSRTGLATMRAEKTAREQETARVANDPGRRRAEELRAERNSSRTRPASAVRPSAATARHSSTPVRAAAERSPARKALQPLVSSPAKGSTVGIQKQNQSINALVLLVMLLAFAIFAALIWYGYGWYQELKATESQIEITQGNDAIDSGGSISIPSTAIPIEANPDVEPQVEETPLVAPSLPSVTPEALEAAAYEDAVLLLERKLAQALFLELVFVDGIYTIETLDSLRRLASTIDLDVLAGQVVVAGLEPTREDLDSWFTEIEPNI